MHPPFTGLIAPGTVEAALEQAPHQGIQQHPQETYQRSRGDEHGISGNGGADNRDDQGTD
jgi:hypothetical protein